VRAETGHYSDATGYERYTKPQPPPTQQQQQQQPLGARLQHGDLSAG